MKFRYGVSLTISVAMLIIPNGLSALASQNIDQWNELIDDGINSETGLHPSFRAAVDCYRKAATLAQEKHLQGRFYAESLCRQAAAEVKDGQMEAASQHKQQIMQLHKDALTKHQLDPELEPLMLKLADRYAERGNDLSCLENAFNLRMQVVGKTFPDQPELAANAFRLAEAYDDRNQSEKALSVLKDFERVALKSLTERGNAVVLHSLQCHFARSYELSMQYPLAKQAELKALSLGKLNPRTFAVSLPSYYAFLGMNALAQKRDPESRDYFTKAKDAASQFKGQRVNQQAAINGINYLVPIAARDKEQKRLALAEGELKALLDIERAIPADKQLQHPVIYLLLSVLKAENKLEERKRLLSNSGFENDPDKSDKPAISEPRKIWQRKMDEAAADDKKAGKKLEPNQLRAIANDAHLKNTRAQDLYLEALKLAQAVGPESTEVQLTLSSLIQSYLIDHKLAVLYPYQQRLLSITNRFQLFEVRQNVDPEVFKSLDKLASAYEAEAKNGPPDWRALCWTACVSFRSAADPNDKRMPESYLAAGQASLKDRSYEDAENAFTSEIKFLIVHHYGDQSPVLIGPLCGLAKVKEAQGDLTTALHDLDRALSISVKNKSAEAAQIRQERARLAARK